MTNDVDLFIIGGGINGAGIARDAAGRGLSVVLCEKDDLAQGTSSRSGKLVHGGLRYLEYYEFRLVREALIEREVLLENASHIIWPMRFVLPHSKIERPAWLVRLGLFLYDHLGGRKRLPGTRTLNLRKDAAGRPLKAKYRKGFEYSDCWVDDARLVVLNAVDAAKRGACVLTRTACVSATRDGDKWRVETQCAETGATQIYFARALVNAGGPWVNDIIGRVARRNSQRSVRLVKGSHLITKKFWDGPQAYLVQNDDKRVIFINPYEGDKALIGTTDIQIETPPETVEADEAEIAYLLDAVNKYFEMQLTQDDVLATFSGVRPLYDDGQGNPSAVTRDYLFDLDDEQGAPLLNIFGGKITTYRKLSEHAMQRLSSFFPNAGVDWTAHDPLPGGDIENADFDRFLDDLKRIYPWLDVHVLYHLARLYGTRVHDMLASCTSVKDLGTHFGGHLYELEVRYLLANEWARSAEDIIVRRTKEYLHMSDQEIQGLVDWIERENRKSA